MGQITGDSIVLLKLLEPATGVLASDFRETLGDMDADGVVNSRPPVELAGQRGFARVFDGATPTDLEVVDSASALNLTRSVTFQTFVRLNLADQDAAGVPGTIASYGFRDSAAEDLQFLVELDVVSLAARTVNVRMRWEDATGTLEAGNAGATFVWETFEADDRLILITVVREWISDVEVTVRYYVDDTLIGTETSTDGDIGGAAGATFFLGVRGDGAGGYENNLEGKLENVELFDFPMTSEEIRQIFRRFAVHEPEQTANLRKLVPERVWSTDLDSIIQREFRVEGAMMGLSASKIAELLEDFLPDRAWSFLDQWETVLGLIPGPADTVSVRRNRLLSFLRTIEGFSVDGIKNALEATFDLDASDIEILEFSNTTLDDFATDLSDYFQSIPGSHTITLAAGTLAIATAAGVEASFVLGAAPHVKGVIDGDVIRSIDPSEDAEVSVEITAATIINVNEAIMGVGFINQIDNRQIWVGVMDFGAGDRLASREVDVAGGIETVTDIAALPALPFFLNVKFTGGTTYEISTAPTGDRNDLTLVSTASGLVDLPQMIVLGVFARIFGGTTSTHSITFDNFRLFTPNGLAPFHWYAFRDPILPGSPDIPGANAVVRRIKPAHTTAAAVAIKALLCDDPASLCDDGPLG